LSSNYDEKEPGIDRYLADMHQHGYAVIASVLSPEKVESLWSELDVAMREDIQGRPNVFDAGMVHNCFQRGDALRDVLNDAALDRYISPLLGEHYIMYAYQSSSLPPQGNNYGSRLHVDSPRFIDGYQTNIGVIFPLTDFNEDNGATWILPGSHLKESAPSESYFNDHAVRANCKAGDMIVFMGRLWHKAGSNQTSTVRHSITINFCRSYMRQRFDFPRLVDNQTLDSLNEQGRRLIGMNVRMPSSLDEFYLPKEQRLYKPNQG